MKISLIRLLHNNDEKKEWYQDQSYLAKVSKGRDELFQKRSLRKIPKCIISLVAVKV